MKQESLKSRVNNKKGSKIKGKITKSSMTFNENKPNSQNNKIGLNPFKTSKYAKLDNWLNWKNKPNSNPIKAKTNPIQTQFNRGQK